VTPPPRVRTLGELTRLCSDDPLCVWAAQGLPEGVRAWAAGGAVAVAAPDVCRRDRLAVHGPAAAVTELVAHVLPRLPPSYRLFGDADLVAAVARELPGIEPSVTFGWMSHSVRPPGGAGDTGDTARWLGPGELVHVEELLDTGFPGSYARPGASGVRRWAGIRDSTRRLVAVAADAWSAPTVGFIAGVAVHPHARGRGLARAICSYVTGELVTAHGRACLMVERSNTVAVRTYERLGFTWRAVRAGRRVTR
jgi:GNAT superfamily N-acetyltransferase